MHNIYYKYLTILVENRLDSRNYQRLTWYAYFFCLLHRPFHKIIDFGSMTEEELGEIWFLPSPLFSTHTNRAPLTSHSLFWFT